jgi:hypothetical protein
MKTILSREHRKILETTVACRCRSPCRKPSRNPSAAPSRTCTPEPLGGDCDPRAHEFSVQLRGMDAAKSGAKIGVASLIALCSALLRKSVRGGLIVVGEVTLGGTIEPIHNAVSLAEIAVEKGVIAATTRCVPSAAFRSVR